MPPAIVSGHCRAGQTASTHRDIGKSRIRRQRGLHHSIERENVRQHEILGARFDLPQMRAHQHRRQPRPELHGRPEQHHAMPSSLSFEIVCLMSAIMPSKRGGRAYSSQSADMMTRSGL